MIDLEKHNGAIIDSVSVSEDQLTINLRGGPTLKIFDDARYCCEHRYMNCDDNLSDFNGAKLLRVEVADGNGNGAGSEYDDELVDILFLKIHTSEGIITVANYNEHNGYYGGFELLCDEVFND